MVRSSDLQVEGRCFDAARMGRQGEMIFRWMTLRMVRSGRRLVVQLAGAALDKLRQAQLLEAWENARRL